MLGYKENIKIEFSKEVSYYLNNFLFYGKQRGTTVTMYYSPQQRWMQDKGKGALLW